MIEYVEIFYEGEGEGIIDHEGKIIPKNNILHDRKKVSVSRSNNLQPLIPQGYPTNPHLLARESNFEGFCEIVEA